jgi:hypothetical protein
MKRQTDVVSDVPAIEVDPTMLNMHRGEVSQHSGLASEIEFLQSKRQLHSVCLSTHNTIR